MGQGSWEGGVGGIGYGTRITYVDQNNLNAADGYDNGEFSLLFDVREIPELLSNLMLKVVNALAVA